MVVCNGLHKAIYIEPDIEGEGSVHSERYSSRVAFYTQEALTIAYC